MKIVCVFNRTRLWEKHVHIVLVQILCKFNIIYVAPDVLTTVEGKTEILMNLQWHINEHENFDFSKTVFFLFDEKFHIYTSQIRKISKT